MKKILVTDGAEFFGSHFCECLSKEKHNVLCVDNFYTGLKGNISHLTVNPNFEIARIFSTYGPCMLANDRRVISNFIVQALKNTIAYFDKLLTDDNLKAVSIERLQ